MALNQRRLKILGMLREDGHVKVQELSHLFNVSEVTIRQDLEVLEQMGVAQREHGGAFLADLGDLVRTGKLFNQANLNEKREIAHKALKYINEGDIIILDSGSTTTEIARLLMTYKNITVITNAMNIAMMLGENPEINLIVTGGEFKAPTLSLTGQMAANSLQGLHAGKLFLATAGVSADMNLTYPSLSDLVVKRTMCESADKIFLVADSHKINVSAFAVLGPITMADILITDSYITEEAIDAIHQIHPTMEIV